MTLLNTSKQNRIQEHTQLFENAKQQSPGIMDLMRVYGDYEESIRTVQQYLDLTQSEPTITTSNQSV